MEAAEKIFEGLEKYRNELQSQIKGMESKLKELASAVPLAQQRTDAALAKIKEDFDKEKAVLEAAVIPLCDQKRVLDRQIADAKNEFELFLSQKATIIEAKIGEKNLELNAITKKIEDAGKRLTEITNAIASAKDAVARI